MTKKEKRAQIALGTYLQSKWKEYLKLRIKEDKLFAKATKIFLKVHSAEANKLYVESDKCHIDGRLLFIDAVIEVYGKSITINWEKKGKKCKLGNGLVFE